MMNEIIKYEDVESKVITLRGEHVIIDRDVAELYGVETRDINKAVTNNREKFPDGYVFEVSNEELEDLRCKFSTANISPKSRVLPKAFTERGLYMLATILKSPQATQTTLAIVETFTKIRELARTVDELSRGPEEFKQKTLMQKGGDIIAEILGSDLTATDSETILELNFALFKVKHTVKRKNEREW